jgi:hypothetical protein
MAAAVLVVAGALPAAAAAAPGWTAYPGSEPAMVDDQAHLAGVEIDRDGAARVYAEDAMASRSPAGDWSAPTAATPPSDLRSAARARVVDGRIVVALRGPDGTYGRGLDVGPAGPETVAGANPAAAVSENGDAVVAWTRRGGPGGRQRLVAATKLAGHAWSAPRVVAGPDFIGGVAAAADLRGLVVMWGQGRLARRGDPPRQRIYTAEQRLGATAWSARSLGFGNGSSLALAADGAGTVHALWGRSLGRPALMARRMQRGVWRRTGAVPGSGSSPAFMKVSPLGDVFVVDDGFGPDGRVHHRSARGRWSAFPDGNVPAFDAVGGISLDLETNAAGDAVLAWSNGESNSRMPLRAAYYEAPARPVLTAFSARRAGRRVVLDASLSGPGRVLVQVRRAGGPRILDGFIATARGGRTTIAVPARVRALLGKPGRYELRADTGGRDEAASTRTATLTTP